MRFLYRFFFNRAGWTIKGDVPRDLRKYIIAVAPHSSNWDFLIGLAVRSIKKFPSGYLAKKELFKPPFGWLFRALGGYPVDRSRSKNLVDEVVKTIESQDDFVVAITPEGTRNNKGRWKTGFYHIAYKANIPIVFAALNYKTKTVEFFPPFHPSGNLENDAPLIDALFDNIQGKNRMITKVLATDHSDTAT